MNVLDDIKIKKALKILQYEIKMFNESYNLLILLADNTIIKSIILENFLLHTRNLFYFLTGHKDDRDIICSDLGIDKIDLDLPEDNSLYMIDKYLSHITKQRIEQVSPTWHYLLIKQTIDNGLEISGVNKLIQNNKEDNN